MEYDKDKNEIEDRPKWWPSLVGALLFMALLLVCAWLH